MPLQPSPGQVVDLTTIRRIGDSWPGRATVRHDLDRIEAPEREYDADLPDYPLRLLPFAEHPGYLRLQPEQQRDISTMAWLVYNERVIGAEEHVANPTFAAIVHGVFPGATSFQLRRTVQQAHVDETFHTYMHMVAMERTRELRRLPAEPAYPASVTVRRLLKAQGEAAERWERDLLALVWTTVAEISVNAYLSLLSRDGTIQPMHALVPLLHARDESAHGSLMIEVVKSIYVHLDDKQRSAFRAMLPLAVAAFTAQDFSAWRVVLEAADVPDADGMVADCEGAAGTGLLVRDFSGIRRLVRELEIDDQVDLTAVSMGADHP